MIPLISSLCYGPLGACQLPRLWWKVTLNEAGALAPDYPECSGGLDSQVMEKFGLDKQETLAYIHGEKPNYLQFEQWIREQKGGALDTAAVQEWNSYIRDRVHKPAKLADIHQKLGLENDGTLTSALLLNHLEDWHIFHQRDLQEGFAALGGQTVPLISTLDHGPLEVCQLPRTWLKVVLRAKDLLHPDYPDCGGGLDARVLDVLGLDKEATLAYLRSELPSYLAFENWVLEQSGGKIDRQAADEWNEFVSQRVHNDDKRVDIHAILGRQDDGTLTAAAVLNHVEDWHLVHAALTQ